MSQKIHIKQRLDAKQTFWALIILYRRLRAVFVGSQNRGKDLDRYPTIYDVDFCKNTRETDTVRSLNNNNNNSNNNSNTGPSRTNKKLQEIYIEAARHR